MRNKKYQPTGKWPADISDIPENTPEEEAEIQRQIASNPIDAAEITDEEAKHPPMTFAEVMEMARKREAARVKKKVGRPKKPDALVPITLRLPPEIVERFKTSGRGWRTEMAKLIK